MPFRLKAKGVGVAGVLVLLFLGACAAPQTRSLMMERPEDLPPKAEIAGVPFFPQEERYCGPASLAMALAWSGLPVDQTDIAPQVFTPGREGTLRSDMMAAARRNGRLAVPVGSFRDLLREIAAGHPVVVFQNLALEWYPQWHFAVAIGYDLERQEMILHSGLEPQHVIDFSAFEHTWRRGEYWAITVLPPDRLPATAGATPVFEAAAGLERADRPAEAVTAYAAAIARWPDEFIGHFGLGNARYAARDFGGAEKAYREALARAPDSAPVWNNLAYALAAQGRRPEAVAAARKAVELAGDNPAYRDTLKEILAGKS